MTMLFVALQSCDEQYTQAFHNDQADSLINEAYKRHDYDSIISMTNRMQATGELSDIKAYYWRGYANSRQQKMRLAEGNWQRAIAQDIHTKEDLEYYSKSANRLSGALLLKGEYESTLKVAVPAIKKMQEAGIDQSSDFAYLLITVGCCQLKLENSSEASDNFEKAYRRYRDVIKMDPDISQFTSAIVGIITITDNYILLNRYSDAYYWTARFDELLSQYRAMPNAEETFLDKQKARLNFYRATALEGLGHHNEASRAYNEAVKTVYATTNEGKMEATTYLMSAKRWDEAAKNFEVFDEQVSKYGVTLSIDIIQHYLIPKYKANVGAGKTDSALFAGMQICDAMETAVTQMKQDESLELATLYNLQQKETDILQEKTNFARQRYWSAIVALLHPDLLLSP